VRTATILTLILLSTSPALRAEDHGSQNKEIFDWGTNRQTFDVKVSVRRAEGKFTISDRGLAWEQIQTSFPGTGIIPWQDITSWYCQGEGDLYILWRPRTPRPFPIGFKRDELVTVVNNYLVKYAPDSLDTSRGCAAIR
jgi:hypothetical protein